MKYLLIITIVAVFACNNKPNHPPALHVELDTTATISKAHEYLQTGIYYGEVAYQIRTVNGVTDTILNADAIFKMAERLRAAEDSLDKCLGR